MEHFNLGRLLLEWVIFHRWKTGLHSFYVYEALKTKAAVASAPVRFVRYGEAVELTKRECQCKGCAHVRGYGDEFRKKLSAMTYDQLAAMSAADSVFDGGDQPPDDPSRHVVSIDVTALFNWLMNNQSESRQTTAERLLKAFHIQEKS